MSGAGERVQISPEVERDSADPFGVLILPSQEQLSTPEVYRTFDQNAQFRSPDELERLLSKASDSLQGSSTLPPKPLLGNDLERAAKQLSPAIAQTQRRATAAGADHVFVSGSGPTVFALFDAPNGLARASAAAATITAANPEQRAIAVEPVEVNFGEVMELRSP
jgi:4-diphosphocytidyl-2C-methyl-D-erythritol kinase